MVLNLDLNAPPPEVDCEDGSPLAVQEVVNVVRPETIGAQVDVEVMVLSALSSQAGSRPSAARVGTMIDDSGNHPASAEEEATRLTLNSLDWNLVIPPDQLKRVIENCDNFDNLDNSREAKKTRTDKDLKPKIEVPNELTFRCTICLGPLLEETSTTCGHIFCQKCIKSAIKMQKKCPMCGKNLNMKSIHRIYFPAAE